jgi:cytochrome d ubiquinol oxidase subunit I
MGMALGFHIIFATIGIGLPVLLFAAEGLYLRTGKEMYRNMAKRWSIVVAVLFAVGAVSGTILSFSFGLFWPRWMDFAGGVIGLPFVLEGVAFFIEAVFIGIYLYGWDRLSPVAHWLSPSRSPSPPSPPPSSSLLPIPG